MNNNELKNLSKNFNKVIEKLTDDLNERFKIYNEFIVELDQRLTEQDKKIEELKKERNNNTVKTVNDKEVKRVSSDCWIDIDFWYEDGELKAEIVKESLPDDKWALYIVKEELDYKEELKDGQRLYNY